MPKSIHTILLLLFFFSFGETKFKRVFLCKTSHRLSFTLHRARASFFLRVVNRHLETPQVLQQLKDGMT